MRDRVGRHGRRRAIAKDGTFVIRGEENRDTLVVRGEFVSRRKPEGTAKTIMVGTCEGRRRSPGSRPGWSSRHSIGVVRRAAILAIVLTVAWATGPADAEPFEGSVSSLDAATRRLMRGSSWHAGCPVPMDRLREVHVTYVTFDGTARHGRLVVHRRWGTRCSGCSGGCTIAGSRSAGCAWSTATARTTARRCATTTPRRSTAARWPARTSGRSTRTGGRSTSTRSRTRTSTAHTSPPAAVVTTSTARTSARDDREARRRVAGVPPYRLGVGRHALGEGLPALLLERPIGRGAVGPLGTGNGALAPGAVASARYAARRRCAVTGASWSRRASPGFTSAPRVTRCRRTRGRRPR